MSKERKGPLYPLTYRRNEKLRFCQWCGGRMEECDGSWVHEGCVEYLISSPDGMLKDVLQDVNLRGAPGNAEMALKIQERRLAAEKLLRELASDLGAEVIERERT